MADELKRAIAESVADYWTTFHMILFQKMLEDYPDETNRLRPAFDEFMQVLTKVSGSGLNKWTWKEIRSRLPHNEWINVLESEGIELTREEYRDVIKDIVLLAKARLQGIKPPVQ